MKIFAHQYVTLLTSLFSSVKKYFLDEQVTTEQPQNKKPISRYYDRLDHVIVVKLYHPYTQFPHNVCPGLSHWRIATFLVQWQHILIFLLL